MKDQIITLMFGYSFGWFAACGVPPEYAKNARLLGLAGGIICIILRLTS